MHGAPSAEVDGDPDWRPVDGLSLHGLADGYVASAAAIAARETEPDGEAS